MASHQNENKEPLVDEDDTERLTSPNIPRLAPVDDHSYQETQAQIAELKRAAHAKGKHQNHKRALYATAGMSQASGKARLQHTSQGSLL